MSDTIIINATIAREHGINVERLIAFHARWGFTVTTSDRVGRTKTSKTCACCGKNRPLEDFPQAVREDGQGGRRSRNCEECVNILPTSAERRKIADERRRRETKEAAKRGITVDQLRERNNRTTYARIAPDVSATKTSQ
jgi:hypothetical protein